MRVLIADDDITIRAALSEFLTEWGHTPVPAENGQQAWEIVRDPAGPSLAVIDWMMPEMDGLTLLNAIRDANLQRYIYSILLTSRQEENALFQGFEAGADDFVMKPFDARELHSRIKVGARMIRKEREVRRYAEEMESLAAERAAQLMHADRLSTLGTMAAGIAHEINNPTSVLFGSIEMIEDAWKDLEPALQPTSGPLAGIIPARQLDFMREEIPPILKSCDTSLKRIAKVVSSLQSYSRKAGAGFIPCNLNDCIRDAVELCAGPLKRNVIIRIETDDQLPPFTGDAQEIHQVIINLTMNAAHAMEGRDQPTLLIRTGLKDGNLFAEFQDNGPGIPDHARLKIWTPFYTTKSADKGTGLGLAIAQSILNKHGGQILAENAPEGGARFTILLPPAPIS